MATCREEWVQGEDCRFYTRLYRPSQARTLVVFCHGFSEHVSRPRYIAAFDRLASAHGIAVFTFDQRGFGKTAWEHPAAGKNHRAQFGVNGGWTRAMADLTRMIQWAQERVRVDKTFLMGHSMGGGLVLAYGLQGELKGQVAGIIAIAPLIAQPAHTAAPRYEMLAGSIAAKVLPNVQMNLQGRLKPEWTTHDREQLELYRDDPLCAGHLTGSLRCLSDMLLGGIALARPAAKARARSMQVPFIILHGTGDEINDFQASKEFFDLAESLPKEKKELKAYDGAYHELLMETKDVADQVARDITEYIEANL